MSKLVELQFLGGRTHTVTVGLEVKSIEIPALTGGAVWREEGEDEPPFEFSSVRYCDSGERTPDGREVWRPAA